MAGSKRSNYSLEDGRQVLAGVAEAGAMRETDRRGLTLPSYAVLQTAVTADAIRGDILKLLEPPPEGADRMEQLLDALEAVLERLDRIERKVDAWGAASRRPGPPAPSRAPVQARMSGSGS